MKHFAIVAGLLFISVAMSSCMRQKYNHGLPRNNFDRPAPHKRFVKQQQPAQETQMFFVKAK